jgi:hypothetical protein
MDKNYILQHIDDFSAEQLFGFIKQGIITIDDLRNTGNLDASKRKAILTLQAELDREDDNFWALKRYSNESALSDYIAQFPKGRHVDDAKNRIKILEQQRNDAQIAKQDILNKIRRNPNYFDPNKIIGFLQNGTITETDLINSGIPNSAIENLENIQTPKLQIGQTPTSIPDGYTEVYFWGGTGSGKTCALGAILQMADQKGYLNIATGPGYHYANQIKSVFSDDDLANDYLPAPSPVETTQYLPFTLKRPNEKYSRSVSLIELSGEIFKCFYFKNAGLELPTQTHVDTFNSLNNFLNSSNRKIHFFFIDYNRENKPDGSYITQSGYLAAASTYFNNNQVFGKTTDAIYVVLTKSDLLTDEEGNSIHISKRVEYAKKHLDEKNYNSFINTLKDICKKYSINAGKLTVEPFSLGKVYFQQICNFDGSAADTIVELLMDRITENKKSILDVFNK